MSDTPSVGRVNRPVFNYVYDSGTLSWVAEVQAGGGTGGAGDASAANQVTGNASLTSIDGKTPALGQALAAASTPVVLTAIQVAALTPPAAITGFALEAGHLATLDTKTPALGQALAAASTPVVLTAIQQAALTPPAAITGFLTETDFDTKVGSLTEAAPASDTASSGLNGRLQRIAQRLTSFIALFPAALVGGRLDTNLGGISGTAVSVNSGTKDAGTQRVVLATDQPALTNKLLVTPDSVALPANQSVNVNQLAGTATSVNSGVKDAGTLRVILATDQPQLTNKLLVTPDSVALPANQSVNVAQFGGTNASTGTGAGGAGIPRVTVSNDSNVIVTPPTLTKGTQGATGFSTQDLKDAGRNQTNFFHAAPIVTTTAEVMQTLTGYKSGAAVAATATPAVVTAGKTYRINSIEIHYVAATALGGALVRLRANTGGVAVIGSPLVKTFQVGMPAVFTAGTTMSYTFNYPDGVEFAAGTGIAVGVQGVGTDGTTGTITGKVMVVINGYEY